MRDKVLVQLQYPRSLVSDALELQDCPHNGNFDKGDRVCLDCDDRSECQWLYDHDEFSGLQQKPMAELRSALSFGIDYVAAQAAMWQHNSENCDCETCQWLRQAQTLYDQTEEEAGHP